MERVGELADVGDRLINPGVFVIGEVDVVKCFLDKARVSEFGVRR